MGPGRMLLRVMAPRPSTIANEGISDRIPAWVGVSCVCRLPPPTPRWRRGDDAAAATRCLYCLFSTQ
jgi:hypothetical protein